MRSDSHPHIFFCLLRTILSTSETQRAGQESHTPLNMLRQELNHESAHHTLVAASGRDFFAHLVELLFHMFFLFDQLLAVLGKPPVRPPVRDTIVTASSLTILGYRVYFTL